MKLTDTQLVLLSSASQRQDGAVDIGSKFKGGAVDKVIGSSKTADKKFQPRNRGREIFTHRVEETTRERVSAGKKIAHDAEKVAETRAKIELIKIQILP